MLQDGSSSAPILAVMADEDGAAPPSPAARPMEVETSRLAITSLILSLLSPFFACLCGLSLFTSLAAVVTGHVALAKIHRSAGRLTGRGLAIAGLVGGYLLFGASVAGLVYFGLAFREGWREAAQQAAEREATGELTAEDRLRRAEESVLAGGSTGVAAGNSPAAQELARRYAESLKLMRGAFFTPDNGKGLSLTRGEFLTYCELHEDRCAFLVHVPSYRDFDDEAKKFLAELAWNAAQSAVEGTLKPGDQLAVGLRGVLLYGAVMTGQVAANSAERDQFKRGERDDLLVFFSVTPDSLEAVAVESQVPPASPSQLDTTPAAGADSLARGNASSAPAAPLASPPAVSPFSAPPSNLPPFAAPPDGEPVDNSFLNSPTAEPAAEIASTPRPTRRPRTAAKPDGPADRVPVSNEVVQRFPEMGWAIESLAFAPNGRWLAAGKMDHKLLWLDVETGATLSSLDDLDDLGQVTQVAVSPDGRQLVAAGFSGKLRAWTIDDNGKLKPAGALSGHQGQVKCLAFSPAASFVMSGGAEGELIWQTVPSATAKSRQVKALPRNVLAIHLPATGVQAFATDGGTLAKVDLREATILDTRPLRRGSAHAASFSSDGSQLAVSSGSQIEVFDTASGTKQLTLDAGEIQWSLAFRPDREQLVSGGRGQAMLWDLASRQAAARFDLGGVLYIQTLAVSRDGTLLAAIPASAGQTLTVLRLPE